MVIGNVVGRAPSSQRHCKLLCLVHNTGCNSSGPSKGPGKKHQHGATPTNMCVPIFVSNSLAAKGGQGVLVPIVSPFKFWINFGGPQHVKHVLYLGGKLIPQLQGEITVSCCQCGNEGCLECLHRAFGGIHVVDMRKSCGRAAGPRWCSIDSLNLRCMSLRTELSSSSSVRCRRVDLQTNTLFNLRILAISADPVSMAGPR